MILTICDADAMPHRDYFTSLTLECLQLRTFEERMWSIYQGPVVLLSNWTTVPMFIRSYGYVTYMFECAGLSLCSVLNIPHLCFSCYSLPFALADHEFVQGWDTDLIAEDHHMFIKCMAAHFWARVDADAETHEELVGR